MYLTHRCSVDVRVRLCRPRVKDPVTEHVIFMFLVVVIQILCPLTCPFFWVNCCSVVCRKCTVEKRSITVGFYMLCPAHDILLAHMIWHLKCVQTWVGISSRRDPCTFPQSHSITLIQCTLHPVWHNPFTPCRPHKKYGGYWWLSWRTGGSEDDNEKLDDLRLPCVVFCPCLCALLLCRLPLISCRSSQDSDILLLLHRPATSQLLSG